MPIPSPPSPPGFWKSSILALGLFLLLIVVAGDWFDLLDLRWMDATLQLRSRLGLSSPLAGEILIVEMDNQDLSEFGSNGEYAAAADTIRRLAELNVRATVLDVLYSRGSAGQQQLIRDAIEEVTATTGTKIVLPAIIHPGAGIPGVQRSLPLAEGNSGSDGIINMEIDSDRIWRRYSLTHVRGSETYPSLALAAFAARLPPGSELEAGIAPGELRWKELADDFVTIRSRRVDTTPRLLNFPHSHFSDEIDRGAGRGRRVWNLRDFHALAPGAERTPESPFQGAVVFFGYGTGLDEKATCMGGQEPGVFLHAVALSNLIEGDFLRPARPWQDATALLLLGGALILLFRYADNKRRLFGGMVFGLVLIFGGSLLLIWHFRIVPGVAAPAFLWCAMIVSRLSRLHTEELIERVRLDTTIGYYFSPNVLRHVRENPGSTEPREAELTLLLSDVRHFTRLCQTLPAREMFDLLGEVFEIESTAAMRCDGSLQHFWGDQFVAYWGAPEPQPDAADRALAAAGEILIRLEDFRRSLPPPVGSTFGLGIGLHRGEGLVGNMGAGDYLDFTVFGDAVNTSARIESLTKHYGVPLLASRQFYGALKTPPASRLIDRVIPVGIVETPIEILQLLPGTIADSPPDFFARFEEAGALYAAGDFDGAARGFEELAGEFDDPPSRTLAIRCREFLDCPPRNWNGIYRFSHK